MNKVNQFISDKNYVLITAHLQPSEILASLTTVGKKCLYVLHVSRHLTDIHRSIFYKIGLKFFLRGKKVITVSKGLEMELNREYGISPDDTMTIYNPCVTAAVQSECKKIASHRRPYILVMGRLEKQKNPLLSLDLYYRGKLYHKYDLVYLGKGSLAGGLKEKIAVYGLEQYVFLEGFQKDSEQWVKNAALLLSCSKYEGLPMNLIEALVCGTPVVASDCLYGPNEILTDELARYLIDPEGKPHESISTILSALNDYPAITEKYYKKFDPELIIQTYLNVWESCFGSGKVTV